MNTVLWTIVAGVLLFLVIGALVDLPTR